MPQDYDEAFRRIKEATGVSDVNEVSQSPSSLPSDVTLSYHRRRADPAYLPAFLTSLSFSPLLFFPLPPPVIQSRCCSPQVIQKFLTQEDTQTNLLNLTKEV